MNASLFNLLYLAFRLAPFILICYFLISTIYLQEIQSLIFLGGLIGACLLAMVLSESFTFFNYDVPDYATSMCHITTLSEVGSFSKIPLSTVIYTYALSYLGIPILHYNRNNSNIPILVFFPVIAFLDMLWLYLFGCSTMWNIFTGGVVGMTVGLAWSEIIFRSSYKKVQYESILSDSDECSMQSAAGFQCVQRSPYPVDPPKDEDIENNALIQSMRYLQKVAKDKATDLAALVQSEQNELLKQGRNLMNQGHKLMSDAGPSYKISISSDITTEKLAYRQVKNNGDPYYCVQACSEDAEKCAGFTHYEDIESCSLQAGTSSTKSFESSTYFQAVPPGYTVIPTLTYATSGPSIQRNTLYDCAALCDSSSSYTGFVYNVDLSSNCLLSVLSDTSGNAPATSVTDYYLKMPSEFWPYDVAPGVSFTGGDTSNDKKVTNITSCINKCEMDDDCIGFGYNVVGKSCFYKNDTIKAGTKNPGFITYIKQTGSTPAYDYISGMSIPPPDPTPTTTSPPIL